MVPQTDLKVRMGIQGIALPSFTTNASQILDDDVAAISLNYQFNENVALTALWARPYNDNAGCTVTPIFSIRARSMVTTWTTWTFLLSCCPCPLTA